MSDLQARLQDALADRYSLDRELGAGGMATVYLAHDLKHDRKVAIKVLRPELVHALGPERFLREIATTANLHHPHVLPLYDSGRTAEPSGALLYYVMPFVEGESLRDRLKREKQLPLDDALRIAREVADALSYAHAHGVIHRDIKPENILLESGHALVADFGIARAVSTAGADRLTDTGLALGTPAYMSPEQAAGDRDVAGEPRGPRQRISITEALRVATLNGAHASFEERLKGSIEPGKLADLVVLGRDPLKEYPFSLISIPVERTMVGGRWVYES